MRPRPRTPSRKPPAARVLGPLSRAAETAKLAGFPDAELDPNLMEWDYGEDEGLTTPQIASNATLIGCCGATARPEARLPATLAHAWTAR